MELAQRQGDFAMAGIACHGSMTDGMRLVYFASESKPTLAGNAMAALAGGPWPGPREEVLAALARDLDPMSNLHGGAAMKLHLQRVLTGRALDTAMERAES